MPRLAGKVAVITGAGSGIGEATALLFATEGAKVLAFDKNADTARATADAIRAAGGTAEAMTGDAGEEADVSRVFDAAVEKWGQLDIVFANAGIPGGWIPLRDQTPERWAEILRVNLIGPFLAVKHASRHMVPRGQGSIVCTASVAGINANAGIHPYSASKAGVISLVKTSAYSLAGTGVRVNAVCPGIIETGMTRPTIARLRELGREVQMGKLTPLRRNGMPNEIATMVLYLASDEASYVNGQAIAIDGGLTASMPYDVGQKS